ncbi:unnamed protein product [Didymodactylos carnosus]|uniref:Uncharacterized protein n=1 Tax=Didymodactylos carnosus TaxID=1234261 RepID=A0A814HJ39_9BILA|nr:unnamed protein product [Didymodactylos carnosus]CAF1011538.1 unnamed protein product [Didymodactylos carnosus]CAF3727099.1 unnamed protein product [Didymodactylos carnosus]CAF3782903.1 unnamed protein product [Didymodactylos carnosus]
MCSVFGNSTSGYKNLCSVHQQRFCTTAAVAAAYSDYLHYFYFVSTYFRILGVGLSFAANALDAAAGRAIVDERRAIVDERRAIAYLARDIHDALDASVMDDDGLTADGHVIIDIRREDLPYDLVAEADRSRAALIRSLADLNRLYGRADLDDAAPAALATGDFRFYDRDGNYVEC